LTNAKITPIINLVKKLLVLIQGLFVYLFLAFPAFAQTSVNPCSNTTNKDAIGSIVCILGGQGGGNIATTIQNIVVFFVILAVVIALLYLLYGGVKWIMSRGEKTEVEGARNHIMAAILGLIVVFLAVFILSIILAAFGVKFESLKIPVITSTGN